MAKVQEETLELVKVGKLKEYTKEICRCKKYVCSVEELREYDILEKA